jgi:hypothetical protein
MRQRKSNRISQEKGLVATPTYRLKSKYICSEIASSNCSSELLHISDDFYQSKHAQLELIEQRRLEREASTN